MNFNKQDRYTKHSSTLLLETYNGCEVPAGCGGVVIRWVSTLETMRAEFFSVGKQTFRLDGVETYHFLPLVMPGKHVLSAVFDGVTPEVRQD